MPQADSNPAGKTNIPISIGSARSSSNASIVDCYNLIAGGSVVNDAMFNMYIYKLKVLAGWLPPPRLAA